MPIKWANQNGPGRSLHFRWPARCLFISNIVTLSLPKTFRSLSSARISRRFSGFCRLCERMYSHILLTTWPRASGAEPTTAASSFDGCSGFCSAFALPALAFFSRVFVAIDLLLMLCGGIAAPLPVRFRRRAGVIRRRKACETTGAEDLTPYSTHLVKKSNPLGGSVVAFCAPLLNENRVCITEE